MIERLPEDSRNGQADCLPNYGYNLSVEEKNTIGYKALAGQSVTAISKEHGVNRTFVYKQKDRIKEIVENEENKHSEKTIILNNQMIKKIIVALMLYCKASTEDTKRLLFDVFDYPVSIGKVSGIINEAADQAEMWNNQQDYENIKDGANDEIFMGNTPILVGVEPRTTYTYLLDKAEKRDAATWEYYLSEKKEEQNLNLETSANDGGLGLRKGIKDAFPDVNIQLDVFHVELDISKAIRFLENCAYKNINEEYKCQKKLLKKNTPENIKKYESAVSKANDSIQKYDTLFLLYSWIVTLLAVGGYTYDERAELFEFIIVEIEKLSIKNKYLDKSIKFMKGNLPEILQFVKKLELDLQNMATEENIPVAALEKMWEQKRYTSDSGRYNFLEGEIGTLLGSRYEDVCQKFKALVSKIVRASSIVECINSLIRPYLFLKKTVPRKFLALLQFYFNTRKYRRSRRPERVGKSPIEMLTGKSYPNPLETLGY